MLIIGINGSPQKGGNAGVLLREALRGAESFGAETKIINVSEALAGQENPFCIQCVELCDNRCAQGNALGEAYNLLRSCDGLILASPVYFGTVTAQLKAFWDKTRLLRKEKALYNVVGGALAVGASRFGGQETTLNAIYHMMLVQGMTIVGDGLESEDCGHLGGAAQRPAEKDAFGLKRALIVGKRVAQVALGTAGLRLRP